VIVVVVDDEDVALHGARISGTWFPPA